MRLISNDNNVQCETKTNLEIGQNVEQLRITKPEGPHLCNKKPQLMQSGLKCLTESTLHNLLHTSWVKMTHFF